jgi:aspartate/methionine/tyrosine aminotransferase
VTTGSSAAFNLAFLTLFDPGDRVAITAPGYPAYRNIMAALGLEVVEIPLGETGYLTAEQLAEAHARRPLKGVLFASPANPTGAIIPDLELEGLLECAASRGIAAISDEIYHRLNYVGPD